MFKKVMFAAFALMAFAASPAFATATADIQSTDLGDPGNYSLDAHTVFVWVLPAVLAVSGLVVSLKLTKRFINKI